MDISVLDYQTDSVYLLRVEHDVEDVEQFLKDYGFKLREVSYLVTDGEVNIIEEIVNV